MKSLIDCINEAYKIKMSKVFSTIDKLERALMWHPGSRSSLPKTLTEEEFKALSDNIYKEYKVFVNGYIFSDDGELYLAYVQKSEVDTGKLKGGTYKYSISIFIESGYKLNKLHFSGFEIPADNISNNEDLIKTFKNGISLNQLVKKYKYDVYSKLNSSAQKFVKELEEK